eukprot:Skav206219  [mRNA]  locus=scaffold1844:553445:570326:- [translate_table: standard]
MQVEGMSDPAAGRLRKEHRKLADLLSTREGQVYFLVKHRLRKGQPVHARGYNFSEEVIREALQQTSTVPTPHSSAAGHLLKAVPPSDANPKRTGDAEVAHLPPSISPAKLESVEVPRSVSAVMEAAQPDVQGGHRNDLVKTMRGVFRETPRYSAFISHIDRVLRAMLQAVEGMLNSNDSSKQRVARQARRGRVVAAMQRCAVQLFNSVVADSRVAMFFKNSDPACKDR